MSGCERGCPATGQLYLPAYSLISRHVQARDVQKLTQDQPFLLQMGLMRRA